LTENKRILKKGKKASFVKSKLCKKQAAANIQLAVGYINKV